MSKKLLAMMVLGGFWLLVCLGCGGNLPDLPFLPDDNDSAEGAPADLTHGAVPQDVLRAAAPWQQQLMPLFEDAAAAYNVPVDLLVTLAKIGSGFENRGQAATIEGGYGLMALRQNDLGGDSLARPPHLTGATAEQLMEDPAASIIGAAAVLSAYADEAERGPVAGHRGMAAGRDQVCRSGRRGQQVLRLWRLRAAGHRLQVTNSYGETFAVERHELIDGSASLVPPGIKKIPLEALRSGVDPDTIGHRRQGEPARSGLPGRDLGSGGILQLHRHELSSKDTIVVHTIEGSAAGTRSWFKNCNASGLLALRGQRGRRRVAVRGGALQGLARGLPQHALGRHRA